MNGQENGAELAIMSLVIVVLSILGIVAGFSRGLFGGIDGLLALGIALMMLLIFGLLLVVQAVQMGDGLARALQTWDSPPRRRLRPKRAGTTCLWRGFAIVAGGAYPHALLTKIAPGQLPLRRSGQVKCGMCTPGKDRGT